jgi:5'-3' exoribonuclease 1
MGIPYYFYTLYKKYNKAKLMITEYDIANMSIEHLFFDYNSMIHPCAHQALAQATPQTPQSELETQILEACLSYTRYVIDLLKPVHVHIMIDGVAPRAKINQQRERRYKSHFLKTLSTEQTEGVQWDTNKITPGTYFMKKLKTELVQFVTIMCRDNPHVESINISDADEPGEGEHKMMKYIEETMGNTRSQIAIYGLDADLIMLSLLSKASD